jgi:hypothetical protein
MSRTVAVYILPGHQRSRAVCTAWERGLRKLGERVSMVPVTRYRQPEADIAVLYGLTGNLAKVFADYRDDPKRRVIFADLGFFGRKTIGNRFGGYHRICVDSRHPTAQIGARDYDDSRLRQLGVEIRPWRKTQLAGHVVVAGMSAKAAAAEGLSANAWETKAIATIRKHTNRRILYRPKPSWDQARPIAGTDFSKPGVRTIEQDLAGAHCIVSHHSNANVEALAMGVPSFTVEGVASHLSLSDLSKIREPIMPEGRESFFRALAWTQWNIAECAEGLPFRHLLEIGAIE